MSVLLSPVSLTKEQWLEQNGELVDISSPFSHPRELLKRNCALVCMVRNFLSTVAVLVPNNHYYDLYTNVGEDKRVKKWYAVPLPRLKDTTSVTLTPNWETFFSL